MTLRRWGSGRARRLCRRRRAPRINSYAAGPVLVCVCAVISRHHPVLHVKPTKNWRQSILRDEGDEGQK